MGLVAPKPKSVTTPLATRTTGVWSYVRSVLLFPVAARMPTRRDPLAAWLKSRRPSAVAVGVIRNEEGTSFSVPTPPGCRHCSDCDPSVCGGEGSVQWQSVSRKALRYFSDITLYTIGLTVELTK